MTQSTVIIGIGSWGKALATLCQRAQPSAHLMLISQHTLNKKQLPISLRTAHTVTLHNTIKDVIEPKSAVIIACQSQQIAQTIEHLAKLEHKGPLLCASKGFTKDPKVLFPHEYYQKIHGDFNQFSYLYGPTFSEEVLQEKTTHAVLGSANTHNGLLWHRKLQSHLFYLSHSNDLNGLAYTSVFKNIVAIISGCMRGCQMGENAQAALITHAVQTLNETIEIFGGNKKTTLSVAGLGDIVLSATSLQSRNFKFGYHIATQPDNNIDARTTEGLRNLSLLQEKTPTILPPLSEMIQLVENCMSQRNQCHHFLQEWLQSTLKV
jgi:glycerol-3-phosphate dehydrogenase (NAD(P)+)